MCEFYSVALFILLCLSLYDKYTVDQPRKSYTVIIVIEHFVVNVLFIQHFSDYNIK